MKIKLTYYAHIISYTAILAYFFVCISCSNNEIVTQRQTKDKKWIEQALIDNIEADRLSEQDSMITAYFDSISRTISHTSIFAIHAQRRLRDADKYKLKYKYKPYPQHASEQIDAYVDKIYYSDDSLKCTAIVVLDVHFDKLPEFDDPRSEHTCHGFAIFGVRDNIEKPFKIYPQPTIEVISYDCGYKSVARYLAKYYNTNSIRYCPTAGTYMEERDYKYPFGHKDFFNDSPDFKTDSMGNYWCQYEYKPVNKPTKIYYLYSNRDDAYLSSKE